ncbi:SDR family oxidoreductase [Geobacter sp. AOG1]|uniref:SDR family oxidoreductase n=1 Tax=Geobacter sp. AOG1 TaxID=1566346 RepID=UPI001CC56034|nr:SDR family oxidoreductase [Geobacter sp. AOG1]GFE58481.1 oxidoreductase [Geobacter sp. AOG1]
MQNIFSLQQKVAVVTGGAGLLGRAIIKALVSLGADVIIADLDLAAAQIIADAMLREFDNDPKISALKLDIASEDSILASIDTLANTGHFPDIWVNNAYPRTDDWGLVFEKIPAASWRCNVDKHMNGYCLCCQKIAEVMKNEGHGSIINMGSIYGMVGPDFSIYEGTEMTMPAAYAAIKGGILSFTRYLAAYYGPYGVRVNAVSPGGVFNGQDVSFVTEYSKKPPMRRMGKPEDVAAAVAFLASDSAGYITGHNLVVDGGWTII